MGDNGAPWTEGKLKWLVYVTKPDDGDEDSGAVEDQILVIDMPAAPPGGSSCLIKL